MRSRSQEPRYRAQVPQSRVSGQYGKTRSCNICKDLLCLTRSGMRSISDARNADRFRLQWNGMRARAWPYRACRPGATQWKECARRLIYCNRASAAIVTARAHLLQPLFCLLVSNTEISRFSLDQYRERHKQNSHQTPLLSCSGRDLTAKFVPRRLCFGIHK